MAVTPNGGIAVSNLENTNALDDPGRAYDPFGNAWHWTGCQPYRPAKIVANAMISQQADDWCPVDRSLVQDATQPVRVVELPADPSRTIAQRIAALEEDRYLMAVAAARTLMRNMYNGAMTATFGDDSQAYLNPAARIVQTTR